MEITPNNKLWLLKDVDLDPAYNYTIDFDNLEAQENYFDKKIYTEFDINDGYSYTRDNRAIKIEMPIDKMLGINYFMFENEETNKRYYAFILSKEWVRSDVTAVTFKIDVMQSFMFDYDIDESFIDREHQDRFTKSDGELLPIYNNVDENISYGKKYKLKSSQIAKRNTIKRVLSNGDYWLYEEGYIVAICKKALAGDTTDMTIFTGNFLVAPYYIYAFPFVTIYQYNSNDELIGTIQAPKINYNVLLKDNSMDPLTLVDFGDILNCNEFKDDNTIISLYYSPNISSYIELTLDGSLPLFTTTGIIVKALLTLPNNDQKECPCIRLYGYGNKDYLPISKLENYDLSKLSITNLKDEELETKLNTNPYYYYQLENDNAQLVLFNEYLDKDVVISCKFIENVQPKTIYSIKNYLGNNRNEELIDNSIRDLPIMTDSFLSYIAQNKASATTGVAVNTGYALANLGIGLITGGVGLAVGFNQASNIAQSVTNEMIKREDLKQQGENVKNAGNNGFFTLSQKRQSLKLNCYTITDEYKKRIFNYFYHYGYKCNDFKKPNLKSRYYFNFIKTIGVNIKTGIDADFKNELRSIFDNGITIFHYRDNATFKGVNNFDYENVEMNLLED